MVVNGFLLNFECDGGEGAEKQLADVGEDGGAPRGDAVLGEEEEEIGEELVDVRGGVESSELADEVGGEVGGIAFLLLKLGVTEAEAGSSVGDAEATAAIGGGAMLAAR